MFMVVRNISPGLRGRRRRPMQTWTGESIRHKITRYFCLPDIDDLPGDVVEMFYFSSEIAIIDGGHSIY